MKYNNTIINIRTTYSVIFESKEGLWVAMEKLKDLRIWKGDFELDFAGND